MPIKHEIAEPWRSHIAEVRLELTVLQRHLAMLLGQLVKEAELPGPVEQYQLSPDGMSIVSKEPHA